MNDKARLMARLMVDVYAQDQFQLLDDDGYLCELGCDAASVMVRPPRPDLLSKSRLFACRTCVARLPLSESDARESAQRGRDG